MPSLTPEDDRSTMDGMEARIAKVEASITHLERDVAEIRSDLRDVLSELRGVRSELRDVRQDARADFRVTWGAMIAGFLGMAGLMARGFGWL